VTCLPNITGSFTGEWNNYCSNPDILQVAKKYIFTLTAAALKTPGGTGIRRLKFEEVAGCL